MYEDIQLDLDYVNVREALKNSFSETMHATYKEQALARLLEQANDFRSAFTITVQDRWSQQFPGVDFEPEIVDREVDKILKAKIAETIENYRPRLKKEDDIWFIKEELVIDMAEWKRILPIWGLAAVVPLAFWLITRENNVAPLLGVLGLVCYLVFVVIHLLRR